MSIILLGPQRKNPRVAEAVGDLGVDGPLALVTAGWEEREAEDSELNEDLSGLAQNLGLFPRMFEVYRQAPTVAEIMGERDRRRWELRNLYRLRLAPQLEACRQLLDRTEPGEPSPLIGPEVDDAIAAIAKLDRHHEQRLHDLEREIDERLIGHDALDYHRHLVAEQLNTASALLIAGGNVAVLETVLRLFNVVGAADSKPVVAWAGGAMVLSERIVLFHDSPAWGLGDPEVFGPGFGLVKNLLPLPHAQHRLALEDRRRVALMARRFAPSTCVALDYGDNKLTAIDGIVQLDHSRDRVLNPDGNISGPPPQPPTTTPTDVTNRPTADRERAALIAAAHAGHHQLSQAIHERDFPIVSDDGSVLYAFVGHADEVRFHHWISSLPSSRPFERTHGTDLWTFVDTIQRKARVEYKLELVRGGHHELIRDPLNDYEARDPFGANSVVAGPDYARPDWTFENPSARKGSIVDGAVNSTVFGSSRHYRLYLPARFRPGRTYPLVVAHDGEDYLNYASLGIVLDNLIHRLEIPPVIVALIQSPDRLYEYGASDAHARFVAEELLPSLESNFSIAGPSQRVLMGASFGGVASLHTAWTHPGVFDRLLLQSGSFAFTDIGVGDFGPPFEPVVKFVNEFRANPGKPAEQIFMSAGVYESLIYFNRSMQPLLAETGAKVRFVEAQDGHNWENWRDHLRDGLTYLLPGPQWLVYE